MATASATLNRFIERTRDRPHALYALLVTLNICVCTQFAPHETRTDFMYVCVCVLCIACLLSNHVQTDYKYPKCLPLSNTTDCCMFMWRTKDNQNIHLIFVCSHFSISLCPYFAFRFHQFYVWWWVWYAREHKHIDKNSIFCRHFVQ